MAQSRTKSHTNIDSFQQRYSELSDEIRAKNKREDRLLEARLKYYERERNIRLNLLRKEEYQFERTRAALLEQWARIQQAKQKSSRPSYLTDAGRSSEPAARQHSTPELFQPEWKSSSTVIFSDLIASMPASHPIATGSLIRPHSAG